MSGTFCRNGPEGATHKRFLTPFPRSKWVKEQGQGPADFYWQNGYGAFSVSESNVPQVKQYTANQEEHHRKMSFQNEFRLLLKRHGIEYDERYVWD